MSTSAKTNGKSRAGGRKVARLYHFEPATVQNIEFLATLFGGKEKGIAAAVEIAAKTLKGEKSELLISLK
ncbi:MAG TPA: hypothetical protein VFE23_07750 [Usitatibacter sp.]|jgi:hypothetical protein|nr:hypothetical protein [Usitatibacter sp.]